MEVRHVNNLADADAASYDDIPNIPATNYVHITKKRSAIGGQYLLDLSLARAPQSVYNPIPDVYPNTPDNNLTLRTTSGAVTTEIWIIHHGGERLSRASLVLCSDNGFIYAKVHGPLSPQGRNGQRPSLSIELRANYGDISFSLPRCFRGPITIRSTHERIAFSSALETCVAPLSDTEGARVYFVGERPRRGRWHSGVENEAADFPGEPLDELFIGGKHTSVRINWVDEAELREMKPDGLEALLISAMRFIHNVKTVTPRLIPRAER
ncbi:hypothetical protein BJV78DRAFT_525762 [Lactifluus subvellereus]|nr:hypothetical protein BJV78DRAFT_525762 [Lactifluus subvellereus]